MSWCMCVCVRGVKEDLGAGSFFYILGNLTPVAGLNLLQETITTNMDLSIRVSMFEYVRLVTGTSS